MQGFAENSKHGMTGHSLGGTPTHSATVRPQKYSLKNGSLSALPPFNEPPQDGLRILRRCRYFSGARLFVRRVPLHNTRVWSVACVSRARSLVNSRVRLPVLLLRVCSRMCYACGQSHVVSRVRLPVLFLRVCSRMCYACDQSQLLRVWSAAVLDPPHCFRCHGCRFALGKHNALCFRSLLSRSGVLSAS